MGRGVKMEAHRLEALRLEGKSHTSPSPAVPEMGQLGWRELRGFLLNLRVRKRILEVTETSSHDGSVYYHTHMTVGAFGSPKRAYHSPWLRLQVCSMWVLGIQL